MDNNIIDKRTGEWAYVHNEIIDRINELTVDCPECESIIYDDEQYQCGTCGGGSKIHVFDWMNKEIKSEYDKLKEQNNALAWDLQVMATDLLEVKEQRHSLLEALEHIKQATNNSTIRILATEQLKNVLP